MSFRYRIFEGEKCILHRVGRRYETSVCLEASRLITSDETYQPGYNFVTDLRDVQVFDANYRTISQLATQLSGMFERMPASVRYVILAERDVQYGMARMFQQIAENSVNFGFHLCRTLGEAGQILDIRESRLRQMLDLIRVSD